jgi:hypothetical protein
MGGIVAAEAPYVVMGDADDSYDFSDLGGFLDRLRSGCDLVMGNRFKGGIQRGAMPPLHRFLGNPALTAIGRLLFKSPCGDFHCGLRAFRKEAILSLDLRTTGMEFASEMVVKATLKGLRIEEIPTTLSPDGRSRPPHLRTWRDGWRHLRFLLLYSPRWLFLTPGLAAMLVGLAGVAWLAGGDRSLLGISVGVHSLFYSALAVSLGYQAVCFALFTKVFAITEGLLPEDGRLKRLFRYLTLETGLAAGAAMALLGLAGTLWAVSNWGARSFGPLQPERVLRVVIPSGLALALGFQTILASFFLSVLGLRRR